MIQRRTLSLALPVAGLLIASALLARALIPPDARVSAFETVGDVIAVSGIVVLALVTRPPWLLSIGLALTVFNTHWSNIGLPVSVDRLVLGLGIAMTLVRARRDSPDRRLRTRPIHWLLALAALYVLMSAILVGTIGEHDPTYALIDRFGVIPFLLLFAAPLAFRTERDRQVLLGTLVAVGAYLGWTAIFERTQTAALVIPNYINNPFLGIHADRARGPFLEAGADGLAMFACGVAAAVALVLWRDRRWRMAAGTVVALCALGVLLTLTRAAWLAAIAGTIMALLAVPGARRYILPAGVVGVVLVASAFVAFPGLQSTANKRVSDQSPIWDRNNSNKAALRMVMARPLLGFGWGRFTPESVDFYRQSPNYPLTFVADVHNVYLSNAAELGLLGAGLWLIALLATLGGAVLRRGPPELYPWRIGLIAIATSWLVAALSEPLGIVMPTLTLWTWAGVVRSPWDNATTL